MDRTESKVGNQHGYHCPSCGSPDHVSVRALIWTSLTEGGSDPNGRTPDHEHHWDGGHDAACVACGWSGRIGELEGHPHTAPLHYVVVFYGDGEVERARVFTTKAAALACRDKHVEENWGEYFPDEPMPDDPEEAADQFDMDAYGQGVLVHLTTATIEA